MSLDEPPPVTFPSFIDSKSLVRRGYCLLPQAKKDKQSHALYYEQHGNGPNKLIFIMGINAACYAWVDQVEYFGRLDEYSVLVFDNRGVGHSTTPSGPYTSGQMAEDAIVLMDHVGWTKEREVHVVGASLGGMIALELAYKIPKRIASLTLVATTAGNKIPHVVRSLRRVVLLVKHLVTRDVPTAMDILFPEQYLRTPIPDDKRHRTWRDFHIEKMSKRLSYSPPQSTLANIHQLAAVLTHSVSPSRLQYIASSIPTISIVTGDSDFAVNWKDSRYLAEMMSGSRLEVWEGVGHMIHVQEVEKFNELVERCVREGGEKVARERV